MFVYRIVKTKTRTADLSGTGAFKSGGRWNSKGTYMLYTSENSSLALLETLVHFDEVDYPPHLFIITIEIAAKAPVYLLKDAEYPPRWTQLERLATKKIGDQLMNAGKYIAVGVRSAINSSEHNYLLNPLFPGFNNLVKITAVQALNVDKRLVVN